MSKLQPAISPNSSGLTGASVEWEMTVPAGCCCCAETSQEPLKDWFDVPVLWLYYWSFFPIVTMFHLFNFFVRFVFYLSTMGQEFCIYGWNSGSVFSRTWMSPHVKELSLFLNFLEQNMKQCLRSFYPLNAAANCQSRQDWQHKYIVFYFPGKRLWGFFGGGGDLISSFCWGLCTFWPSSTFFLIQFYFGFLGRFSNNSGRFHNSIFHSVNTQNNQGEGGTYFSAIFLAQEFLYEYPHQP